MMVAIRLKDGSKALFKKDENHESKDWGYAEWATLARETEPQIATVLVQVK